MHVPARIGSLLLLGALLSPHAALAEPPPDEGFFSFLNFRGSLDEGGHTRYVAPLTNPLFNETPQITTEARPIYFFNEIPNDFITTGGSFHVVALEIRVALTERLGFIASKDGYAWIDFDKVLDDENGFANISLGFKYALLSMPEEEAILTAGLEYEAPTGSIRTADIDLQGGGDGFFDLFLTGSKAWDDGPLAGLGLQSSAGFNLAVDTNHDTSIFHYSAHAHYEVFENLFPLLELNVFTPIEDGDRLAARLDGVDLVNFGSDDRSTTVTMGGGFRYRFSRNLQMGFGGEGPLTDDNDSTLAWRIYTDFVISF